jgi:hypothetical protein
MKQEATKRCSRCRCEKPLTEFAKKRRQDFQPYCRPCQSEYKKEHYQANKEAYVASVKRRLVRMRSILRREKDRPCADCGIKYPFYVMDLDHREDEEKLGMISQMLKLSEEGFRREMAKCDVICANCHRERTHQRNQYLAKGRRAPQVSE